MNGNNESSDLTGSRPRRVAIITAGGDAPGMNAAIRAVVRTAAVAGIEVIGFRRGYEGLIRDLAEPLSTRSVANMIQRGGTFLETSRSVEFRTPAARGLAARNLKRHQIDALIVVGGEGSMIGATVFGGETGIPVFVIPASIDNDIPGTDYSIGFDTAVNTALDAIDRIRDTAFAYERVFCVEVMGRDSGFIAIAVGLGGGAEAVIVPEIPFTPRRNLRSRRRQPSPRQTRDDRRGLGGTAHRWRHPDRRGPHRQTGDAGARGGDRPRPARRSAHRQGPAAGEPDGRRRHQGHPRRYRAFTDWRRARRDCMRSAKRRG